MEERDLEGDLQTVDELRKHFEENTSEEYLKKPGLYMKKKSKLMEECSIKLDETKKAKIQTKLSKRIGIQGS